MKQERGDRSGSTHHEGVDDDVVVLEGVEGGGGGDAIFAGLAELQQRHHHRQPSEEEAVQRLHFFLLPDASLEVGEGGRGENAFGTRGVFSFREEAECGGRGKERSGGCIHKHGFANLVVNI